jgi:hypothetical protein
MVPGVDVTAGGGGDGGDGGGEGRPALPDAAKSIAVAATAVLLSVLGLAYVFLKYGGDYGLADEERGG